MLWKIKENTLELSIIDGKMNALCRMIKQKETGKDCRK